LAVGLHVRLRAGQMLFDQLSDIARVHSRESNAGPVV
jgi:hypothetical protein